MRTTLNLDDDVVGRLKAFAESRSMALGKAASDLMRRGLNAKVETQVVNGIHVVVATAGFAEGQPGKGETPA